MCLHLRLDSGVFSKRYSHSVVEACCHTGQDAYQGFSVQDESGEASQEQSQVSHVLRRCQWALCTACSSGCTHVLAYSSLAQCMLQSNLYLHVISASPTCMRPATADRVARCVTAAGYRGRIACICQ